MSEASTIIQLWLALYPISQYVFIYSSCLGDEANQDALSLFLEQCHIPESGVHPTMVADHDGDLPLHFAACSGASPAMLNTLISLGDPMSALVQNSSGRLAVDEYIEWISAELYSLGYRGDDNSSSSESETTEGSEGYESSMSNSISDADEDDSDSNQTGDKDHAHDTFSSDMAALRTNWESALPLWTPVRVFTQAAVAAIGGSLMKGEQRSRERELLTTLPHIHSAVVAVKYGNFPAVALYASIVQCASNSNDHGEETRVEDRPFLQEDLYGNIPLFYACGDLSTLMPGESIAGLRDALLNKETGTNDISSGSRSLMRFNTDKLTRTMIEDLVHCEPAAVRRRTQDGRLPLHLLAEDAKSSSRIVFSGATPVKLRMPWEDIKLLLKEYPEALVEPDGVSNLYPFQLAACSCQADSKTSPLSDLISLEYSYRLIKEDPSLLCQLIESGQ